MIYPIGDRNMDGVADRVHTVDPRREHLVDHDEALVEFKPGLLEAHILGVRRAPDRDEHPVGLDRLGLAVFSSLRSGRARPALDRHCDALVGALCVAHLHAELELDPTLLQQLEQGLGDVRAVSYTHLTLPTIYSV